MKPADVARRHRCTEEKLAKMVPLDSPPQEEAITPTETPPAEAEVVNTASEPKPPAPTSSEASPPAPKPDSVPQASPAQCTYYMGGLKNTVKAEDVRAMFLKKGVSLTSVTILPSSRHASAASGAKLELDVTQRSKLLSVKLPRYTYLRQWRHR